MSFRKSGESRSFCRSRITSYNVCYTKLLRARLARLAVRSDESAAVIERLNRVLGMIEAMRAVDTRGVEPMAHAPVIDRIRFIFPSRRKTA